MVIFRKAGKSKCICDDPALSPHNDVRFMSLTYLPCAGSSESNDGEDKTDRQQPLGVTRAWSFDDTLQRQRNLSMRPGVLSRHSLDAGAGLPHFVHDGLIL